VRGKGKEMIAILITAVAFCGTLWMTVHPGPLHGFFHPAHYSTGNSVGQVSYALIIGAIAYLIDRRFRRRRR